MLEAIHPDCVHICLPHYLHYPAALDAARAGCHVLTEKPLAMNIEEAEKIHGTGIHIPSQGWGLLSKQAESHDSGAAERTPGSCQRRRYRNFMVLLPGPGARPTMTRSPGVGKWTLPAAAA